VSFPTPRPGVVIRYGFLWSHEQDAGADEAAKDRPCAIVVAALREADGGVTVIVAPITHAAPEDPSASIPLPRAVAGALGLDSGEHWLRLDELNRFTWPGYDLRAIPGRPGEYSYGLLPRPLFEQLREGILARQRAKEGRVLGRD
jgi:hypothetical protein